MEFNDMCNNDSLEDLRYDGSCFTWSNESVRKRKILCKLDRALINDGWIRNFMDSKALFDPSSISNNSSCIVYCATNEISRKIPFKFFTMWVDHKDFLPLVCEVWAKKVEGSLMFKLVSKLKWLKSRLKKLNKNHFTNILKKVTYARDNLLRIQRDLIRKLNSDQFIMKEKVVLDQFVKISLVEESLAKQKSHIQWLKEGDSNTSYFFKCINS